jgi:hypothetical protein
MLFSLSITLLGALDLRLAASPNEGVEEIAGAAPVRPSLSDDCVERDRAVRQRREDTKLDSAQQRLRLPVGIGKLHDAIGPDGRDFQRDRASRFE